MERSNSRRRRRPAATTPEDQLASEPLILAPEALTAPIDHEPVEPLAIPELTFAARAPLPLPEPPRPSARRAIFFDVENTSSPGHIARLIDHLGFDRAGFRTEFIAVGNWRVIGADTARLLARHGAQLVHSAPSTGVRDWSDLRIAVSAGVWLASARPGDALEIVSDDRAFDAVGDVAAALGIDFRRLSARGLAGAPSDEAGVAASSGAGRGRRGRRRGRGGREAGGEARRHEPAPAVRSAHTASGEAHTTPHDELLEVVRELAQRSPNGAVLIDTLSRTLKARGFSRPPGSPRLVTRLRRMKELAVSPTGMITVVGEPHGAEPVPVVSGESPAEQPPVRRRRRRGRRGGRGRRRGDVPPAG